jgi:hypothetical protein
MSNRLSTTRVSSSSRVRLLETRPPYLFDPERVEARIASLPRTASLIHQNKRAASSSAAFPRLSKTHREVLRILGRANLYAHLDELLESLERCLRHGWHAHQLGARDRGEFASLMSDLQVAEHCLERGFTIESPVASKIRGRKPDLYIRKGPLAAIVEVFRPRECPAFHNVKKDVSRLLMEADIRLDYRAEVKIGCFSYFDNWGQLLSPWHPIDLDEALETIALEATERVAENLVSLAPTARALMVEEWPVRNVKLTVELSDVRESEGDEPNRRVVNTQSFGGYDPIGMLARLMKPIVAKAKKRQAGARCERARLLVCDVSDTVVAAHLQEEHLRDGFIEVLLRELEPQVRENYDSIALCARAGLRKPLQVHFSVNAGPEYHSFLSEFFGEVETLIP